MATLLLMVIFLSYIGLGIPDSLFGTAWPAMGPELGMPLSAANAVTFLISGGTMLASLFSSRVINRFGTGRVTAVSTAMTALALLGFSLAENFFWLCLLAVPLGLGGGAVDAALNNYVALHYRASHISFLHCFYGVGVSISPWLMSLTLSAEGGWRGGYRLAFGIQAVIALAALLSLPLWGRMSGCRAAAEEKSRNAGFRELFRTPGMRPVWLMFFGSCALEYTCGVWGSSYLVESRSVAVDHAAKAVMAYYAGMAIGRFLSGLLARKCTSWQIICGGQSVVLVALVTLLLPLPAVAASVSLFLVGLGNGPFFPNLVHLTPQNFGREISQAVMGSQMAASCAGILLAPPVFGFLAQKLGTGIYPWYLLGLFAVLASAGLFLWRRKRISKTS